MTLEKENKCIHPKCNKVYQTTGWALQKVNIMSVEEEKDGEVCTCVGGILNKNVI